MYLSFLMKIIQTPWKFDSFAPENSPVPKGRECFANHEFSGARKGRGFHK